MISPLPNYLISFTIISYLCSLCYSHIWFLLICSPAEVLKLLPLFRMFLLQISTWLVPSQHPNLGSNFPSQKGLLQPSKLIPTTKALSSSLWHLFLLLSWFVCLFVICVPSVEFHVYESKDLVCIIHCSQNSVWYLKRHHEISSKWIRISFLKEVEYAVILEENVRS